MKKKKSFFAAPIVIIAVFYFLSSCSKSSPGVTPPADICAGKIITITATPSATSACNAAGSIDVIAVGSTGFTYKIDAAGTYQASGTFHNLAAGTYTVFAKDAAGCEKNTAAIITISSTPGTLFAAVKNLIAANCQSCHNNSRQEGNKNWEVECNIISSKDRIKVRAVDLGTMPPGGSLSQSQKDIITNWINAGGKYNN